MIRIAGFDYLDMNSTDGLALAVYAQGCSHHCKGCHNPELWDFYGGTAYDNMDLINKLTTEYNKGEYDYIVLLGGDFLCLPEDDVRFIIQKLVDRGIKIWMYTGYDYDEVPQWAKRLCYCIKCGLYDVRFPKRGKLATGNQAYYFKNGKVEY